MERLDLTGNRYGRLVAIEEAARKGKKRRWRCICDCGNETVVFQNDLRLNKTTSCGCYHKEVISDLMHKHGGKKQKERLYTIWNNMKNRCRNPNDHSYEWYGGKGICVCNEWKKYEFFRDWALENGYEENLTIDRIDSEKDYSPKNCRWITASENSKRVKHPKTERRICVNGESKTESAWAKLIGVSQAAISGWVCKYGEDFASKKIAAHIALR